MNHKIRHWMENIAYIGLGLFGPAFADRQYSAKVLLQCVVAQKFLRINHHVPWPVHWTSEIKSPERIQRGTRCPGLGMGCYLDGRNGIIFGRNVWIGPKVSIISMNHDIYDYDNYTAAGPVVVGDNCWLATGCTILPGVKLGNHVIVAAGAVVTESFDDDDIVLGGVPARVIKRTAPYRGRQ
ncbi:MAG TPA: acyltransferase [Anaerolineales bacterium]|nr:acyltransferase [Anaerolineales bacterium]